MKKSSNCKSSSTTNEEKKTVVIDDVRFLVDYSSVSFATSSPINSTVFSVVIAVIEIDGCTMTVSLILSFHYPTSSPMVDFMHTLCHCNLHLENLYLHPMFQFNQQRPDKSEGPLRNIHDNDVDLNVDENDA